MKRKAAEEGGANSSPKQVRSEISPTSFAVGEIRVHCLVEEIRVVEPSTVFTAGGTDEGLRLRAMVRSADWLFPEFAAQGGQLKMAVQMLVVETPGNKCLVVGTGGSSASLSAFDNAGFKRDSVNLVVCPQLHADSIGSNTLKAGTDGGYVPAFPKAKYVWSAQEHERRQTLSDEATQIAPIVDLGLHQLVDLECSEEGNGSTTTLVDEGDVASVTCIPTPGPTPGSMGVMLKSNGKEALLIGGAILHPLQLHSVNIRAIADADADIAIDSRMGLVGRYADSGTLIVGTSFAPPSKGHIELDREKISDYKFAIDAT
jgi:glyoxylase-like metal-dependent hydrolase (beta-lactamase superfamily II)